MKLYQWPSAEGTESIFPRCVVFQRICNIAGPSVQVANLRLPSEGESFLAELRTQLRGLPVLEVNGERLRTSAQILTHLIETGGSAEVKAKLSKMTSVYGKITQQWANESFINSLIWVRWKKEENFQRFYPTVQWGEPLAEVLPRVTLLRREVLQYLQRSPIGGLSEEQFDELLKSQLWALEHILTGQQFFEPLIAHLTLTDLYVFMNIQGLLLPGYPEAEWIQQNCPHIYKWFKRVDALTAGVGAKART